MKSVYTVNFYCMACKSEQEYPFCFSAEEVTIENEVKSEIDDIKREIEGIYRMQHWRTMHFTCALCGEHLEDDFDLIYDKNIQVHPNYVDYLKAYDIAPLSVRVLYVHKQCPPETV